MRKRKEEDGMVRKVRKMEIPEFLKKRVPEELKKELKALGSGKKKSRKS